MKILRMMLLGLLFSLAASYTIIAVFVTDVTFTSEELLKQFTIAAILGPVIGLGSFIYYVERLTLFWQLVIHYIYVTIAVIIAGSFGDWYVEGSFLSIGKLLIIQLIIYIIIWVILSVIAQRDVKEINQKLKRKRENS